MGNNGNMNLLKPHNNAARLLARGKLAFVFSGGFVKGAAHLAITKVLLEKGFKPNLYVGTSIGAVVAVLLAFCDDIEEAIFLYKSFAASHIWPQMLSVNVLTKSGIFEAEKLVYDIAKYAGFHNATFDDLKKPVFVTATDINTGRQIVFGKREKVEGRRIKIVDALEAAVSVPVIFEPKKMVANNRTLALCDGGVIETCPIVAAAKIPGVKRILAIDLGYRPSTPLRQAQCRSGSLWESDYSNKNLIDVFLHYVDLTGSFSQLKGALKDDIFKKKNISVRILNPGLSDVKPFDIKATPLIMERAQKFAEGVLSKFENEKKFFGKWNSKVRFGHNIKAVKMGVDGANLWEMVNIYKAKKHATNWWGGVKTK